MNRAEELVFIPAFVIRCKPGGNNSDRYGVIGYYGGRKVLRWKCNSPGCKYEQAPDGTRRRVVTFHHDDIDTGERVYPNERRPYIPPEER